MAANPFDQFDEAPQIQGGNPFDQFDTPQAPAAAQQVEQPQLTPEQKFQQSQQVGDLYSAIMEPVMTMGSGAAAMPISGLAGLAALAGKLSGVTQAEPADVIERVQGALTYQPRTEAGQAASDVIAYPFEKIAQGGDWLGQKAADVTGSPTVGAGVNTGAQMLATYGAGRVLGAGAKAARNVRTRTPNNVPTAEGSQATARPAPAKAAERSAGLEGVRAATAEQEYVAPDLVLERERKPEKQRQLDPEGTQRAQQYVERTLGMNWGELPKHIRDTLADVATDARNLDHLDPVALKRQLQLESLPQPVPSTRGILTRDPVQLRNEGNVAATKAGEPIRQVHLDANQALLNNLDILKGRVRGNANTPEEVGLSVQDQALRAKLELTKQRVKEKYKAAETAGELQGQAPIKPIVDVISRSPDKTHFRWVESWLRQTVGKNKKAASAAPVNEIQALEQEARANKYFEIDNPTPQQVAAENAWNKRYKEAKARAASGGQTAAPAPPQPGPATLTLKELEDLRQAAVARAMNGGTEGYYAGKVIAAIDQATDGAGGKLYKEARAARRAQAMEFEETGAVARLVDNKSRTDRSVALEDTWRKTVIGGSLDDIRKVKRSLLTGGDAKTRTAGRQAWRDIRAQTIQFIKDEATKSVALNERGTPNITPAAMKRAIDKIGSEKMNEIFGPGTAKRVDRILEATRIVKTEPPAIHKGSSTMGNVLAFLERGLDRLPLVGDVASGAIKAAVKVKEIGANGRVVRESQRTPLNTANKLAEKQRNRNSLAD